MTFRFIVLADPQFGMFANSSGKSPEEIEAARRRGLMFRPAPKFEGFATETALFARAIGAANALRPSFVAICGDMVNDPRNDAQRLEVFRIAGMLDPAIRLHYIPGNHDVAFDTVAPTPESLGRYRASFGPDYYAFREGGLLFIVLNTTAIAQPDGIPGEWDAQLGFVDSALSEARAEGIDRAIVFGHHPLFVRYSDEDDSYWNVPRVRRRILLDLFQGFGVEAMFAGHLHRNSYARHGRLDVISSGPVGYPLGDDPSGYRIVEVHRSGIRHEYRALDGIANTSPSSVARPVTG